MKHLKTILMTIGFLALTFMSGYLIGQLFLKNTVGQSVTSLDQPIWISLPLMLLSLGLTITLQIAIHEAGHVVFGRLTGYRFLSYRIFNLHWQKVDGRIKFYRHSLAGTGGQALMIPPKPIDGKIPYVLYNLGGGLANLLTLPACYGLSHILPQLGLFWELMALMGLLMAVTNLIPMSKDFPNDGYNIYAIAKHPQGSLYFYSQLAIHAQMAQGQAFGDIAEQLFLQPQSADITNPIIFSACLNWANRLMAQERFEEARDYLDSLAIDQLKLTHIYSIMGQVSLATLQLLCDQTTTVELSKKDWQLIEALNKSQPASNVFTYAYHSLVDKDGKKANKALTQFQKLGKTYPYPADYADEKTRMALFQDLVAHSSPA